MTFCFLALFCVEAMSFRLKDIHAICLLVGRMQTYLTIFNIIFTFKNHYFKVSLVLLPELGDIEREEKPKLLFNRKVPGY